MKRVRLVLSRFADDQIDMNACKGNQIALYILSYSFCISKKILYLNTQKQYCLVPPQGASTSLDTALKVLFTNAPVTIGQ